MWREREIAMLQCSNVMVTVRRVVFGRCVVFPGDDGRVCVVTLWSGTHQGDRIYWFGGNRLQTSCYISLIVT